MKLGKNAIAAMTLGVAALVTSAQAGFEEYIIRGNATIGHPAPGQTEFILDQAGEKAALGSNDINGATLGSITSVAITRVDDRSRFTPGSGPFVAPYLNIWITDGAGNFAVIANEPSNPDMQALYSNGWDFSFADLADKTVKIYENSDKSWLPNDGLNLTFADLADFIIQAPTVQDITDSWPGLGTGAPREYGTNIAYGVNWVFGDTLSNYVSGQQGYVVTDARVAADTASVPDTGSVSLLGLGLLAVAGLRWRQRATR